MRVDNHLRILTRCSGIIENTKAGLIVSLWIPGSMQLHIIHSLEKLVQKVATRFNDNLPSDKKITIKFRTPDLREIDLTRFPDFYSTSPK